MDIIVLIFGLMFPLISWYSFVAQGLSKSNSSGVYVPFIGPLLLDLWIFAKLGASWYLLIPWLVDIGTIIFLIALPRLLSEAFNTSKFTQVLLLRGEHANEKAKVSFHKAGNYVLSKEWSRPLGEPGVIGISEPGTYKKQGDGWVLTSHTGKVRHFKKNDDEYLVEDPDPEENHGINGWSLGIK